MVQCSSDDVSNEASSRGVEYLMMFLPTWNIVFFSFGRQLYIDLCQGVISWKELEMIQGHTKASEFMDSLLTLVSYLN
jgi:hypothetical protein